MRICSVVSGDFVGSRAYGLKGGAVSSYARRRGPLPVATLTQTGATGTAVGQFTVKRSDYRIGEGEWSDASLVAHEVLVRFRIALSGLPAS